MMHTSAPQASVRAQVIRPLPHEGMRLPNLSAFCLRTTLDAQNDTRGCAAGRAAMAEAGAGAMRQRLRTSSKSSCMSPHTMLLAHLLQWHRFTAPHNLMGRSLVQQHPRRFGQAWQPHMELCER